MDTISERLATIQQEIWQVETRKLQYEQMLGLFWEHLPPIDPEELAVRMQQLRNGIRAMAERKEALLLEEQGLIVAATHLARPRGPQED